MSEGTHSQLSSASSAAVHSFVVSLGTRNVQAIESIYCRFMLFGRPYMKLNSALLADELAAHGYLVVDQALPSKLAEGLRETCLSYFSQGKFNRAGVGSGIGFQVDRSVRDTFVHWWEPDSLNAFQEEFAQFQEELRQYFNRYLMLGLQTVETHFAVYSPGSFYERHLDQFKGRKNRQITLTYYLNPNWLPSSDGQLRMYLDSQQHFDIYPEMNRMVLFRSGDFYHEVIPTRSQRLMVTSWFKNREWPLS